MSNSNTVRKNYILWGVTLVMVWGAIGCVQRTPGEGSLNPNSKTPLSGQRPFLVFLLDQTGFAQGWWQQSIQVAAELLKELARPHTTVVVLGIDRYSYEDSNVLIPPIELPGATLRVVQEVRKLQTTIRTLPMPPKPDKPGTDIEGALHLVSDYVQKRPNCWVNIFLFSDLVEEHKQPERLASFPRFTVPNRMICLFVTRLYSETEYIKRREAWMRKMRENGIAIEPMYMFAPEESIHISPSLIRAWRQPPAGPMMPMSEAPVPAAPVPGPPPPGPY